MAKIEKIYKQFIAKIDVDDDERTVTAIISTIGVDRDNEVLLPKGAVFDSFLKNPVVLWAHQYGGTPIGKAQWITKGRKLIKAKVKFADTEKAEDIYQLFKGGFLNAFSIGFIPLESHKPTEKEIEKRPELATVRRIYDEWELLEFSAVPVPSNPEALATAVKTKALDISTELKDELGMEEKFYPVKEKDVDEWEKDTIGETKETDKPEKTEPEKVEVSKILRPPIKLFLPISMKQGIDKKQIALTVVSRLKGKIV